MSLAQQNNTVHKFYTNVGPQTLTLRLKRPAVAGESRGLYQELPHPDNFRIVKHLLPSIVDLDRNFAECYCHIAVGWGESSPDSWSWRAYPDVNPRSIATLGHPKSAAGTLVHITLQPAPCLVSTRGVFSCYMCMIVLYDSLAVWHVEESSLRGPHAHLTWILWTCRVETFKNPCLCHPVTVRNSLPARCHAIHSNLVIVDVFDSRW